MIFWILNCVFWFSVFHGESQKLLEETGEYDVERVFLR